MNGHECVTRDSRVASHTLSHCPDPTRPDPTHYVVAEASIVTAVETDAETWMETDDLNLLDDEHSHCRCIYCQPEQPKPLSTFIALCGRRGIQFVSGPVYTPPPNACPDCLALHRGPCPKCGH